MISDEMKELLSAYVDDELRATDVARVEDLVKRDPELRHEVDAYRKLRSKLKDWDEAEHGVTPSDTLARRALARARTLVRDRKQAARGRLLAAAFSPLAVAAGLLLATGLGLWFARGGEPAAPVVTELGHVEVAPAAPMDEVPAVDSAVVPFDEPPFLHHPQFLKLIDRKVRYRIVDGVPMSDTAAAFLREQERLELVVQRRKARKEGARALNERRTSAGSYNAHVAAMVRRYDVALEAYEGLVLLRRARIPRPLDVAVAPVGSRGAYDQPTDKKQMNVRWMGKETLLSPLGEVWIGARDAGQRVRLVGAANLVNSRSDNFVVMAWADKTPVGETRNNLEVADYMLGPVARRKLLAAEGYNEGFVHWLQAAYGGTLPEVFKAAARKHDPLIERLVGALGSDEEASGFAVVDRRGKLLGVEMFGSHELMLAMAPRLLRGYLVEANGVIRLKKPRDSVASKQLIAAQEYIYRLPEYHVRIDDEWRGLKQVTDSIRQVTLRSGGKIVGHGIVKDGVGPIHLSIFGG